MIQLIEFDSEVRHKSKNVQLNNAMCENINM